MIIETAEALTLAAIATAWGGIGMPSAADKILKYKREKMLEYWDAMFAEAEKAVVDGKVPEGTDKDLVDWATRQVTQVGGRKLTREQTEKLKSIGLVRAEVDTEGLPTLEEEAAKYAFGQGMAQRAACALLCAAMPALAAAGCLAGLVDPAAMTWCAGALAFGIAAWLAMALILTCDIKAKLIPWQLCLALGILAAGFAVCGKAPTLQPWASLGVLGNLACGGVLGVAVYIACKAVNGLMRALTGAGAIGMGDLRLMPMLCVLCGLHGSIAGFCAASATMLVIAVVALARGANRHSYVPYAPGLAVWALVGECVQLTGLLG